MRCRTCEHYKFFPECKDFTNESFDGYRCDSPVSCKHDETLEDRYKKKNISFDEWWECNYGDSMGLFNFSRVVWGAAQENMVKDIKKFKKD